MFKKKFSDDHFWKQKTGTGDDLSSVRAILYGISKSAIKT